MHKGLGRAVLDLRSAMQWSQTDLAVEIGKVAIKLNVQVQPVQEIVSRWERGEAAPSPQYRMLLGRVAERDSRTTHLADLFRAPESAWRLVGMVEKRNTRE